MTLDDDTTDTRDEWQSDGVIEVEPAEGGGGGLLQRILEEVSALDVRAQADRAALADTLAGSFSKLEVEMAELREQVASLRADLDASGTAMTNAFTEMLKVVAADSEGDVPAEVEQIVAAQSRANVDAVVAALGPHLATIRDAVPTAETARIALEISRLRQSLIGPDPH